MKKYKVKSVAHVLGVTTSAITAFASQNGFSTKGGIDLAQILQFAKGNRRNRQPKPLDTTEVEELKSILALAGVEVAEWN